MPSFAYTAIDLRGREQQGRLSAPTREEAQGQLAKRRLHVLRLAEAQDGGVAAPKKGSITLPWRRGERLRFRDLTLFTRQLATLTSVSPIEESLRTIARQSDRPEVRGIVARVADAVVEGRRLADALGREPRSFPPLYRAMVSAGESSGSLPDILERQSVLLERQAAMRSKLLSALAYPAVLTLVALGVVAALMIAVVPRVVEQFDNVGQQLPLLTRIIIALSTFMANYWWALLLLIGGGLALLSVALQRPDTRLVIDRFLLRLPFVGRLVRDLHAASIARTLSTMIGSRLPLIEGLRLTAETVHNRALRTATEGLVEAIRRGGSLSGALGRAGVFPPLLVYLAASGESAGRLELMLARAAEYLEREFDAFTSTVLALLEPMIIVVLGVIVATIVLAILLPILQLQSLVGA
ncbi:type II secretion system inner membrane protein GspF [Sphingomonas glaciei]|uniref:General secretion pathway protein F n=1 Tax=Sphingomonas glaciei TaxID=2938948 RepID=A0ABY5MWK7_9SPHN|nr:type II secretion system inner membrane protein GspF [Sphingomonas glaciei]UUR08376.1 type II secretion system inner membrane protein GspF [Sphingomonas glaciei]